LAGHSGDGERVPLDEIRSPLTDEVVWKELDAKSRRRKQMQREAIETASPAEESTTTLQSRRMAIGWSFR
jgi:hypothetical protein